MSRLTLRLPESLHQQLTHQAQHEGVSLNQYLVYLLSQRSRSLYEVRAHSPEEIRDQRTSFGRLLEDLGSTSHEEIRRALDARELAKPEPGLSPEIVQAIERRVQRKLGS